MAKPSKKEKKEEKRVKITKETVKGFLIDYLFIVIGCLLGSFSTVCILIPNGLASGGLTGFIRVLQKYIDVDFSIMYYIGSFAVLVLCAILLGFKEVRKIIVLTITYPTILFLMEHTSFALIEEPDMLLAAIYCGVFSGAGVGLVLSRGYSFGGTDTIAKIIKKKMLPHIDVSKILLVIDGIIIIIAALVYGRTIALYALITTMISSKAVEMIIFGFRNKIVKMEIISDEYKSIADYIMNDLDRGVTIDKSIGAYTGAERVRLVVLCSPRESMLVKKFIASTDKKALVTMIRVDNIWGRGEGFGSIDNE